MNWRLTVFNLPFPFAAVPEKTQQRDVRPQSVDMHIEPAAGTKDTKHLRRHSLWLIAMVKNSMGIDIVEALIRKRQMPRVGLLYDCKIAHAEAGQLYMLRGQIDSRSQGSVFGELEKIAPGAAADFEDLFSRMPAKFCRVIKPWIDGVALFLSKKQWGFVPVSLGELGCVRHCSSPYRIRRKERLQAICRQ